MSKSILGLGLAALGRPDYINIRDQSNIDKSLEAFKRNSFEVLDMAYFLGLRHFDVAPSYGLGEQFLLEWYQSRKPHDVSFSTKFGYTYVANWELGFKGKHEIKEHSISKLNEQWEASKALLPCLKIYQIHSATLESGVLSNSEVLNKLNELRQIHTLKIGISTSGTEQSRIIEEAQKITFDGTALFDSYQVTYNLFEQSCYSILNQLLVQGKTIIIKEALANGRIFMHMDYPEYLEAYTYLKALSKKYGVGADAIGLRFIMDNLEPSLVLSGAANTNQLESNLKVSTFNLTSQEVNTLKTFAASRQHYWKERSNLKWN